MTVVAPSRVTARVPGPPAFDAPVPDGGYRWWYADALSDDGDHALVIIGFVGSVFSPYYAARRRRDGPAPATAHVAFNVAVYDRRRRRWAMTERGAGALRREPAVLAIGPSQCRWTGDSLCLELDERTAPLPGALRGRVAFVPSAVRDTAYALDPGGRHWWHPWAPTARVEVDLDAPRQRWRGNAYLDGNHGCRPLEADFTGWNWSRARLDDTRTVVFYDTVMRDGARDGLAWVFDDGLAPWVPPVPPEVALRGTRWGMARTTRCEPGGGARVLATLEDGPFYSRSLVETRLLGRQVALMHESLSLTRFGSRWVQALLPVRMPRRG